MDNTYPTQARLGNLAGSGSPILPAVIDGATRARLEDAFAASKAPATRRTYRAAWNAWTA